MPLRSCLAVRRGFRRSSVSAFAFAVLFGAVARTAPASVLPVRAVEHGKPAASGDLELASFASRGHLLGFDTRGYVVSDGDHALRVVFEGAAATRPDVGDATASRGKDDRSTKAPPLGRVEYRAPWPGIDVVWDAPPSGIVRSTWTVAPGADPASIRLRYNRPVELGEGGDLRLGFDTGVMTESRPVAWQQVDGRHRDVPVSFRKLGDHVVGFSIGEYRRDLPLVIDPTLGWNSFLGGSGNDSGNGIAVDGSGNVYVVGTSPATWGSPVLAYAGGSDAFVAKLNASGALQWNTFLGSSGGTDAGNAIAVDASGNVTVAGTSSATWGSPVAAHAGGNDAFVAKLDSSGALQWSTFLGGGSNDSGTAVAFDGSGNVCLAGTSASTWGSPVRAFIASTDGFAAKLNSSGVLQWNTFLGSGSNADRGDAIAVDSSGNVYVGGSSNGSWGTPVSSFHTGTDAFAAKLDPSGALQWNTFLGSTVNDQGYAIAVSTGGKVFMTGTSSATWGTPVRGFGTATDAFVAQLEASSGVRDWNTFLGGSGSGDVGNALFADGNGSVYVAGDSNATWGSPAIAYSSGTDAFAAKLDSSGALQWNAFLGGSGTDNGNGVAVSAAGNVLVAGNSTATWGSPVRALSTGTTDALVASVTQDAVCGDGLLAGSESCDDGNLVAGDCCSATCTFEAAGTTCRAAAGACDVAETCTGSSGSCPADAFQSASTACTGSSQGGVCDDDATDHCSGSANTCVDAYLAASSTCRSSTGQCDVAETCTGSSGSCPADSFQSAATACTGSSQGGACDDDASDHCSGSADTCVDAYRAASYTCRGSAGGCDLVETCTGSAGDCPSDAWQAAGTVCRTATGDCDVAETCTGATASCPADAFQSAATACTGSSQGGVCDDDAADRCSGSADSCLDAYRAVSFTCRSSTGQCDVAESCTGSSGTCPADAFQSAATACTGSSQGGVCDDDAADRCSGSADSCVDAYRAVSFACRSSTGQCDVAESCTGSSGTCPADAFQSAATACTGSSQGGVCDDDAADRCSGSADSCVDAYRAVSFTCRSSTGQCDVAETCTGSSGSCPADAFQSASTACTGSSQGGVCDDDAADLCSGSADTCVDAYRAVSFTCRSSTGQCDVAETCTGSSGSCPADAFQSASTACTGSSQGSVCDNDASDHCSGTADSCVDAYRAASYTCRSSTGQCDVAETCTGSTAACPADAFRSAATACTGASQGGVCDDDAADRCSGSADTCLDAFRGVAVTCRASAGPCDVEEKCTGSGAACPADVLLSPATVCRTSAGICDVSENCTGASPNCPVDAFVASTVSCRASAGSCDVVEKCSGSTAACPADAFRPAAAPCRATAGVCDVAEACTGSAAACPADAFVSASVTCRAVSGVCDLAENCTGSAAACPADSVATPAQVCRTAVDSCDFAETCTGSTKDCPEDGWQPDGYDCNDGIFCNGADHCWAAVCGHAGDPCSGPDGDDDCSESCDETGDSCTGPDPDGSSCEDGDLCTGTDVCAAGTCAAGTGLDCDDHSLCTADSCDSSTGCVYDAVFVDPATCVAAGAAAIKFVVRPDDAYRNEMRWRWSAGSREVTMADLGDPPGEGAYSVCVYDQSVGVPQLVADFGVLPDPASWKARSTSIRYGDRAGDPHGVKSIRLSAGAAGEPANGGFVRLGGRSATMPTPYDGSSMFGLDPSLVVELVHEAGLCWVSEFTGPEVQENTPERFTATK